MKISVLLLALLSSVAPSAQIVEEPLVLSGLVEDSKTHAPIADAKVSLPGIQAVHNDYTDSLGVFTLSLRNTVKPGAIVRLRVEKEGYTPYEEKISVAASLARKISLNPVVSKAPPKPPSSRKLSVRGYVNTGDGAALPGVQVLIRGGPRSKETDKAGEFLIDDITPPPDVGFPVTFEVIGWIIEDPFYLSERGQTYLPDPKAPPIRLLVRKIGDPALLQGPSVEKILGARAFDFNENRAKAYGSPAVIEHSLYLPVAARLKARVYAQHGAEEDVSSWDEFLKAQAAVIGVPLLQLRSAIATWVTHVDNPYQRGLASLYHGDYEAASKMFHEAVESHYASKEQLYACVSYAEYKRGNFSESSMFLEKLLALHPHDPAFKRDLEFVHAAAGRADAGRNASGERDRRRFEISQEVMNSLLRKDLSPIRTLLDEHSAEAGADTSLEAMLGAVTKSAGAFKFLVGQRVEKGPGEVLYVTQSQFDRAQVELVITFNDSDLITWASLNAPEERVRAEAKKIADFLRQGNADGVLRMFDGKPSESSAQSVQRATAFAKSGPLQDNADIKLEPMANLATIVFRSPSESIMVVNVNFGIDLQIWQFEAKVIAPPQ